MKRTLGKLLRDVCIALVSMVGISALYRSVRRKGGPLVRVLVFHDVPHSAWFEDTIRYLKSRYHLLTPSDFQAGVFNAQKINVLITFDDGYASWVKVCAPVLERQGVHGLFFFNSGLLDAHDDVAAQNAYVRDRLLLSERDTLSWSGAEALMRGGHTLGGHTRSHQRLATLGEDAQRREIEDDRTAIAARLGSAPSMFAYPFGRKSDYTQRTKELVRGAGYACAFTTESGFVRKGQDAYELPRLCLENGLTTVQIGRWVDGGYDVYNAVKSICVR